MDIYDSEEMKIESEQCKALKSTIETLCTGESTARVLSSAFQIPSKRRFFTWYLKNEY